MKTTLIHRMLPGFALIACCLSATRVAAADYEILGFGAVRSDSEPSTKAINAAIDKCSSDGGGRVVIPAGRFTSGTIFLKSNVDLHLSSGAVLLASTNRDDFHDLPPPKPPFARPPGWSAFLFAENAANVSISGTGVIDGRGETKTNDKNPDGSPRDRVKNLLFVSCRNIGVTGVSINSSNHWNQHYLDCEDVLVDRIRVFNHSHGNNDGIDIDGSRRVVISNSIIDADDDGIVIKSTGLIPTEDLAINNCIVSSHANAIKCGTESLGGFRNIAISNCIIKPSRDTRKKVFSAAKHGISGISLIVVDGGIMEGVSIDNIVIQGTECPLYVRLGNRGRTVSPEAAAPQIGTIRNVRISNVLARSTGNYSASITGIPGGKVEDIHLDNIRFVNQGGLTSTDAYDPATLAPSAARHDFGGGPPGGKYISSHHQVAEDEKGYPQPTAWRNLPSYGLFIRHVRKANISGLSLESEGSEPRVPFLAVDVDSLHVKDADFPDNGSLPDVFLKEVREPHIDPALSIETEP